MIKIGSDMLKETGRFSVLYLQTLGTTNTINCLDFGIANIKDFSRPDIEISLFAEVWNGKDNSNSLN